MRCVPTCLASRHMYFQTFKDFSNMNTTFELNRVWGASNSQTQEKNEILECQGGHLRPFHSQILAYSLFFKMLLFTIHYIIGSGYFAGPGKIVPRSYFAGPCKIAILDLLVIGYFAGPNNFILHFVRYSYLHF